MGRDKNPPLPRWVEVDLRAVAHNVRAVRKELGPSIHFTAVVKSDGYGHGAAAIGRVALQNGADDLAVTYLDEALGLREAGLTAPLLVMGPVDPRDAKCVAEEKLSVMVDNRQMLTALGRTGCPVNIHLELEMGMHRWGISPGDLVDLAQRVRAAPNLRLEGIFAHVGYMAGKNDREVVARIKDGLATIRRARLSRIPVHVANSAVLLNFPQFRLNRVRVGNLIYGINPTKQKIDLKNPWRARSFLMRVAKISAGERVGYGGTFISSKKMVVGTVPVGYAHGLTLEPVTHLVRRDTPPTFWGWVDGVKCPLVGRVGMNHALFDLSSVPSPRQGMFIDVPLRRTAAALWPKIHLS
ncbi:MAG: alanine racemase [Elusimicrobia bacterium]|jgi:alanine racemase|nr:alanine racemase [Elusimicrobiota bacterium]